MRVVRYTFPGSKYESFTTRVGELEIDGYVKNNKIKLFVSDWIDCKKYVLTSPTHMNENFMEHKKLFDYERLQLPNKKIKEYEKCVNEFINGMAIYYGL